MARRRRMAPRADKRRKVWADTQVTDLGFAEDALRSQDLLSDFVAAGGAVQGVTVLRTIISIGWFINETHTPREHITFGLIRGTKTVADVADPVAEPYADWAWLDRTYAGREHGLLTADAPNWANYDVHSMRRIDEIGETWWLLYRGGAPVTATATYDVSLRARTLLLLP